MNFLGEVEELELPPALRTVVKLPRDSDARAVEVVDAAEVEDNFLLAFGDQSADGVAEYVNLFRQDDRPVMSRMVTYNFAGGYLRDMVLAGLGGAAGMVVGAAEQSMGGSSRPSWTHTTEEA